MITLDVNGTRHRLDVEPEMPLLWALRDELAILGPKFGCGIAMCGACTVLVDGAPARACVTPVEAVAGAEITTIEGLSADGVLHRVQQAWIDEQVPQCGYCQAGQIISAVALLERVATPGDAEIDAAMEGHICRCGTYPRIRAAIRRAAGMAPAGTEA